ncbi:hypothetical protein [Clostridium sp. DL1XJH146]
MKQNNNKVISLEEKMEMYYNKKNKKKPKKTFSLKNIGLLILISLSIIIWTIFFIHSNLKATSTVIISTPNKIVLKVNKYNKVTKVEGYSKASLQIANDNQAFLENINDALISLVEYCKENEYITNKSNVLILLSDSSNSTVNINAFKKYMDEEDFSYTINDNGK